MFQAKLHDSADVVLRALTYLHHGTSLERYRHYPFQPALYLGHIKTSCHSALASGDWQESPPVPLAML